MPQERNLSTFFRSKRIPGASPAKKKKTKNIRVVGTKQNLSLLELFSSSTSERPRNNEIQFLSTGFTVETKNDTVVGILDENKIQTPEITDIGSLKPSPKTAPQQKKGTTNIDVLNSPVKKASTIAIERVEQSRKRLFQQNDIKENNIEEPAYKRYAHLCKMIVPQKPLDTQEYYMSASLYIPQRYQRLYDIFVAFETVRRVLDGRNDKCTFDKLKNGIECMTKMQFNKNHLAQILNIMSEYYTVYLSQTKNAKFSRDLIIESINLDDESYNVAGRRKMFYQYLLDATHDHHEKFLADLGVTLNRSELKRWHPKFKIEEIPEIDAVSLPEDLDVKVYSAKDMLHLTCYNDDENLKNALLAASEITETATLKNENTVESTDSSLKFIPISLIDKIREKERKRNERMMLRDINQEVLIGKLQRIPDIMRCIYNYFMNEKKPYMAVSFICKKVHDSCLPDTPTHKIEEYIDLLIKYIPEWVKSINLHGVSYIGIDFNCLNINEAIVAFKEATKDLF